jgi:hypothetical protein
MVRSIPRPIRLASVLGAAAALVLTGCGSTFGQAGSAGPTPAHTTSPAPAVNCSEVSSLRASLDNLTHISVNSTSARQLAADLDGIRAQLHGLGQQVSTTFKSQADELDAALDQLAAQARALAAHPSAAQLDQLGAAVAVLKSMAPPLIAEMKSVCPGST